MDHMDLVGGVTRKYPEIGELIAEATNSREDTVTEMLAILLDLPFSPSSTANQQPERLLETRLALEDMRCPQFIETEPSFSHGAKVRALSKWRTNRSRARQGYANVQV